AISLIAQGPLSLVRHTDRKGEGTQLVSGHSMAASQVSALGKNPQEDSLGVPAYLFTATPCTAFQTLASSFTHPYTCLGEGTWGAFMHTPALGEKIIASEWSVEVSQGVNPYRISLLV
ncbi:hypothetical protein P7K49_012318, partial [Saguinus oedipus]